MKTRKTLALLLTVMMAAAGFAGCNSGSGDSSAENSAESSDTAEGSGGTGDEVITVTWHLPRDQEYGTEITEQVFGEVNRYLAEND